MAEHDPSDADLLARAAAGDALAASALVDRLGPRLLVFARRMLFTRE